MKTIEQIVSDYKSETLDGRDLSRLLKFLTEDQCTQMGIELKDEFKGKHEGISFTKKNILRQLGGDVAFGDHPVLRGRGRRTHGAGFGVQSRLGWAPAGRLHSLPAEGRFPDFGYGGSAV